MVAVETAGRFNSGCRRHEGLELVRQRTVWRPGRLAGQVRIAGRGEVSPVADHRFGERFLPRLREALGVKNTLKRYGTSEKCGAPSVNESEMPGKRSKMR
jgi:hypothetical protein